MDEIVRYLMDNSKRNNFQIIGIAGEEKGKWEKQVMEADNFPTLWRVTAIQIQERKENQAK